MKPTRISVLALAALAAAAVGFLLDHTLTSAGRPTFTPSYLLPILLVLLGVLLVVIALPIRRAKSGGDPVDPFRAVRVAAMSKASSLVGAIVAGLAVGLLVFLLTRPVSPPLGSTGAIVATIVGGVVLIAAALVAEHFCTIGKDDDDDQPGPDEPGLGLTHRD